jgi:hypothetical protein
MRDLRIYQARELEEDPSRIMRDGANLVDGKPVTAAGRTFQLSRWLSTNVAWLYVLIFVFALSDLVVVLWSVLGPDAAQADAH